MESLDPGPEGHAGLRQGFSGKEPHKLIHLLDRFLEFVVRLCIDP
jgi:hypothetical protein